MASATGALPEIRYVRCPKCYSVLPEPSDTVAYQCGRCFVRLRAKPHRPTTVPGTTLPPDAKSETFIAPSSATHEGDSDFNSDTSLPATTENNSSDKPSAPDDADPSPNFEHPAMSPPTGGHLANSDDGASSNGDQLLNSIRQKIQAVGTTEEEDSTTIGDGRTNSPFQWRENKDCNGENLMRFNEANAMTMMHEIQELMKKVSLSQEMMQRSEWKRQHYDHDSIRKSLTRSSPQFPINHYQRYAEQISMSSFPNFGNGRRDSDARSLAKDRKLIVKEYFRPVGGGAPFLCCLACFELLLLPPNFLLRRKRCHKLKCGACGEVVSFSLLDRNCLIAHGNHNGEANDEVVGREGGASSSRSVASDMVNSGAHRGRY